MRPNLRLVIIAHLIICLSSLSYQYLTWDVVQVDLTEYVERHDFVFDAVLDEDVSNDEVSIHDSI